MLVLPVICHNIDFAWGVEECEYEYASPRNHIKPDRFKKLKKV
jgi:hypothetical protein